MSNDALAGDVLPEAGWYDDPAGPGLRWWDGLQWTDYVRGVEPDMTAGAPTTGVPTTPAAPGAAPGTQPTAPGATPGTQPTAPGPVVVAESGGPVAMAVQQAGPAAMAVQQGASAEATAYPWRLAPGYAPFDPRRAVPLNPTGVAILRYARGLLVLWLILGVLTGVGSAAGLFTLPTGDLPDPLSIAPLQDVGTIAVLVVVLALYGAQLLLLLGAFLINEDVRRVLPHRGSLVSLIVLTVLTVAAVGTLWAPALAASISLSRAGVPHARGARNLLWWALGVLIVPALTVVLLVLFFIWLPAALILVIAGLLTLSRAISAADDSPMLMRPGHR